MLTDRVPAMSQELRTVATRPDKTDYFPPKYHGTWLTIAIKVPTCAFELVLRSTSRRIAAQSAQEYGLSLFLSLQKENKT